MASVRLLRPYFQSLYIYLHDWLNLEEKKQSKQKSPSETACVFSVFRGMIFKRKLSTCRHNTTDSVNMRKANYRIPGCPTAHKNQVLRDQNAHTFRINGKQKIMSTVTCPLYWQQYKQRVKIIRSWVQLSMSCSATSLAFYLVLQPSIIISAKLHIPEHWSSINTAQIFWPYCKHVQRFTSCYFFFFPPSLLLLGLALCL